MSVTILRVMLGRKDAMARTEDELGAAGPVIT